MIRNETEELGAWLASAMEHVPGCPWSIERFMLAVACEIGREEVRLEFVRLGFFQKPEIPPGV